MAGEDEQAPRIVSIPKDTNYRQQRHEDLGGYTLLSRRGKGYRSVVWIGETDSIQNDGTDIQSFRNFCLNIYHDSITKRMKLLPGSAVSQEYIGVKRRMRNELSSLTRTYQPYKPGGRMPFLALKCVDLVEMITGQSPTAVEDLTKGAQEMADQYRKLLNNPDLPAQVLGIHDFVPLPNEEYPEYFIIAMELLPISMAELLEDRMERLWVQKDKDSFNDEAWIANVFEWILNSNLALMRYNAYQSEHPELDRHHRDFQPGNVLYRLYGEIFVPVLADMGGRDERTSSTCTHIIQRYPQRMGYEHPETLFKPEKKLIGSGLDRFGSTKSLYCLLTGDPDVSDRVGMDLCEKNEFLRSNTGLENFLFDFTNSSNELLTKEDSVPSTRDYMDKLMDTVDKQGFQFKILKMDGKTVDPDRDGKIVGERWNPDDPDDFEDPTIYNVRDFTNLEALEPDDILLVGKGSKWLRLEYKNQPIERNNDAAMESKSQVVAEFWTGAKDESDQEKAAVAYGCNKLWDSAIGSVSSEESAYGTERNELLQKAAKEKKEHEESLKKTKRNMEILGKAFEEASEKMDAKTRLRKMLEGFKDQIDWNPETKDEKDGEEGGEE